MVHGKPLEIPVIQKMCKHLGHLPLSSTMLFKKRKRKRKALWLVIVWTRFAFLKRMHAFRPQRLMLMVSDFVDKLGQRWGLWEIIGLDWVAIYDGLCWNHDGERDHRGRWHVWSLFGLSGSEYGHPFVILQPSQMPKPTGPLGLGLRTSKSSSFLRHPSRGVWLVWQTADTHCHLVFQSKVWVMFAWMLFLCAFLLVMC